jgi:hypothetical protein
MRTISIALLFLGSLILTTHAQQSDAILLDTSKPTIYLTFERFRENDSVLLRLHNNTRWAISFRTMNRYTGESVQSLILNDGRQVSGLVDGLQIIPEYFIEDASDRVIIKGQYWCTSSLSWLPPGSSIVFSFPRKELKPWGQIYVEFTYEWECGDYDPEHRVRFRGFDLSKFK